MASKIMCGSKGQKADLDISYGYVGSCEIHWTACDPVTCSAHTLPGPRLVTGPAGPVGTTSGLLTHLALSAQDMLLPEASPQPSGRQGVGTR